ncbi:unnamed protein product [Rotaria sp. Silwood1]|nr:unnamed protein product [Rotaria sp. Silwood1]CAF4817333.1 unnamed protein product [Rotaria sp. Silwood1]CAF4986177.1 unnamed protein product [Rotaria sp. Silwood1]
MIVSGQSEQEIVPSIHKLQQVVSIYIYCMNKKKNEQWARTFAKVKAVVVELDELIFRIGTDHRIQKIVEEPLSINIFTTSTSVGTSTMGINGQFVYSQLLIDCFLRLKYIEADKQELIRLCKQKYENDIAELYNLHEFEKKYSANRVLWCAYPGEAEILFMLGSIFRLKSIECSSDSHVWIIGMTLCSDNKHELKHVLMDMKQKLGSGETGLRTLGRLLSTMSKFDLAEKYFIRLTEQLSLYDSLLDDLYEDLGKVAAQAGNFDKGMEWRKKAIVVKKQRLLAGKQPFYSVY